MAWVLLEAAERDFQGILDRHAAKPACVGTWFGNLRYMFGAYDGLALRRLGLDAEADAAIAAAREVEGDRYRQRPDFYGPSASLGLLYALSGQKESALEYAERAVQLLPIEQDAFQGPEAYYFYVRTLAQVGEVERAVDELDYLLSVPNFVTFELVLGDPFLDPIVGHPRFRELTSKYARADAAEQ